MDAEPFEQDTSQQATNPLEHLYAVNSSNFDMSNLTPHVCMSDLSQRTIHGQQFIHCNVGNHGMHIPHGKMLVKTDKGWDLEDIPIRDETGKIIAKHY